MVERIEAAHVNNRGVVATVAAKLLEYDVKQSRVNLVQDWSRVDRP